MQHPRPYLLRQQPRKERGHCPPATPQRAHDRQTAHLDASIQKPAVHRRAARVDRTQQQTYDADSDGLADNIRDEPDEKLEEDRANDEAHYGYFLADAVRRVGECETPKSNASPETGRDVTNARRVAVTVGDQEGNDPAGDTDFGTLVREDEERAEKGDLVPQRPLQQFRLRGSLP